MNTEGCPLELFDRYIEVGEVKESNVKSSECVFIEVWISSAFSKNNLRAECAKPVRRPIYDVLKQIRKLCKDKQACVIVMCDDGGIDTLDWSMAISPLVQQLSESNLLKHTMIYTKYLRKDTDDVKNKVTRHVFKGDKTWQTLMDLTDVLVFGQANCHCETTAHIETKHPEIPSLLKQYLNFHK